MNEIKRTLKAAKDALEINDLVEPIAPYFADAYNTLTSVVQSLALGILGVEVSKIFFENMPASDLHASKPFVIVRLALVFFLICILWHRYITNTQFEAWRLDVFDTIIPLGLGLSEVLLILAIPKTFIHFATLIIFICILGFFAYWNAIRKHDPKHKKSLNLKKLFLHHFGKSHGSTFYDEVVKFEKSAKNDLFVSTVVVGTMTLLTYFWLNPISEGMFYFSIFVILILFMRRDIWKHLENSEQLKEFWDELNKDTFEAS